jgi:hypothetical protein
MLLTFFSFHYLIFCNSKLYHKQVKIACLQPSPYAFACISQLPQP